MTDEPDRPAARPTRGGWLRIAGIIVALILFFVLYDELVDLGGELYRSFN